VVVGSDEGGGVLRPLHGSAGAVPGREAGSGATRHVAVPEPSSVGRRGPKLWYTW
jgi:hypothetical protein